MSQQEFETLIVQDHNPVLRVILNRPKLANAMNLVMVNELMAVMEKVEQENYRVLIISGGNGNFCAGGDIKDMQSAGADKKALIELNRAFGHMITKANHLPCAVICALEGAVLGGGFGLACVSDLAIAVEKTQFGLPETSLGIIPAQIAPFVVQRIGLTQTRRLALFGNRIKAQEALNLGLIHQVVENNDQLEDSVMQAIKLALKCAPQASQTTKALIHNVGEQDLDSLLDQAANNFADAVMGEGREGGAAFMQKRSPAWADVALVSEHAIKEKTS
ncbi:Enoyl-CoA hydratase [Oleispira antarctica RB-8]|uniref:Enoyl-CoA hydratase n=1 Tax=Oleispira antarctica RB-8 TaxID=698738 RepID=R4YJY4_OLEAN|nr:Enoyl-CoA hydratase [Oleispira antarctica RB-8]